MLDITRHYERYPLSLWRQGHRKVNFRQDSTRKQLFNKSFNKSFVTIGYQMDLLLLMDLKVKYQIRWSEKS